MIYNFYSLNDPDTQEVRYIGVTTRSLKVRYAQHKSSALLNKDQTHKTKWFRSLMNKNKLPTINLLLIYECNDDSWENIEKDLISKYYNLTNHSLGGKGVVKGERLKTTRFNSRPVVKIHPWKDEILATYSSAAEAEKEHSGKKTSVIHQTLKGLHKHSFGYRWSYLDPLVFSEPLPCYYLYINNKFYKDYLTKQDLLKDFRTLLNNENDTFFITKTIPSFSN